MMTTRLVFLSILVAVAAGSAGAQETRLSSEFAACRDHVAPAEGDTTWREIAWRATLLDAVHEAEREKKPILLWAMNGHPLACT